MARSRTPPTWTSKTYRSCASVSRPRRPTRSRAPAFESQVPRLGGRRVEPVVVPPVVVAHRRIHQLRETRVVEARKVDGEVFATDLRNVSVPEGMHSAISAERVMHRLRVEAVVHQRFAARGEPEGIRLHDGTPEPQLCADRAVALARAGVDVDIRFEAYVAAVAASDESVSVHLRCFPEGLDRPSVARIVGRVCGQF